MAAIWIPVGCRWAYQHFPSFVSARLWIVDWVSPLEQWEKITRGHRVGVSYIRHVCHSVAFPELSNIRKIYLHSLKFWRGVTSGKRPRRGWDLAATASSYAKLDRDGSLQKLGRDRLCRHAQTRSRRIYSRRLRTVLWSLRQEIHLLLDGNSTPLSEDCFYSIQECSLLDVVSSCSLGIGTCVTQAPAWSVAIFLADLDLPSRVLRGLSTSALSPSNRTGIRNSDGVRSSEASQVAALLSSFNLDYMDHFRLLVQSPNHFHFCTGE